MIEIDERVGIPEDEVGFEFARSSGPGGQHVNRVETKVTLTFDVEASATLDQAQKQRVFQRLGRRVTKRGVLRVSSQRFRTREANRRAAITRFSELLALALAPRRKRVATRTPQAAKRRRIEHKRQRGEIKRARGRVSGED